MLRFHPKSFLIFLLIFCAEIAIALWINDSIIRPFGGDTLVVMLMYYFVKSFLRIRPLTNIIFVTAFAFLVEFAQLFDLVNRLGLDDNRFWIVVIGNSFHWLDLVAYLIGSLIIFVMEVLAKPKIYTNTNK